MTRTLIWAAMGTLLLSGLANIAAAGTNPPPGSVSLFNGTDLSAWVIPKGDNGHWKVIDSVIDYDAQSEARKDKNLWTRKSYGDFVLHIDWRIKRTTGLYRAPVVLPSGDDKRDKNGKVVTTEFPNADSGIYLRGNSKSQVNIWCWPIGSGEVYGYRKRTKSAEIRRGVTPKVKADHPVGQWNTFVITMKGDRLSVVLNGKSVLENARLPGVPKTGPIGLQHHGGIRKGQFVPASSLVQFRNIWIKELKD